MNFNNRKLRGRIREILGSEAELGRRLGLPRSAISARLSNKTPFTRMEIALSAEWLELDKTEIGEYFFDMDVAAPYKAERELEVWSAEQVDADFDALQTID